MPEPKFQLGRVVATPGALDAMRVAGAAPHEYLARHVSGDWGTLTDDDRAENEVSLREGLRILSAYMLPDDIKIWIITEADRSATTILLHEEY